MNQGENAPPLHPRCRCTIVATFDTPKSRSKPVGERSARETGNRRERAPADMTYRDWKAVYIDKSKTLAEWRSAKDAKYRADSLASTSTCANVDKNSTTGALNNKNDPTYEKRDKAARKYYERARAEKESFIKVVSQNSGMREKSIEKIFNHIFIEKHELRDGFKRFDPSYEMAESFRRLSEGIDIQPHDLILIKHEWLELGLMKCYGYDYSVAHRITERKYNYDAALTEWQKEGDEW